MNNPQMDMPKSHPSPSRSPSTDRQRRNALIVSITMTVMAIPSVGLFIYYGLANDVWQFNVFSGLIAVSGILNIAAVILTLRGKSNTGMLLCISGAMFVILIAPFMLQGAGFILLLAAVIIYVLCFKGKNSKKDKATHFNNLQVQGMETTPASGSSEMQSIAVHSPGSANVPDNNINSMGI